MTKTSRVERNVGEEMPNMWQFWYFTEIITSTGENANLIWTFFQQILAIFFHLFQKDISQAHKVLFFLIFINFYPLFIHLIGLKQIRFENISKNFFAMHFTY